MPHSRDWWDEKLVKTTAELPQSTVRTARGGTWVFVLVLAAIVALYVVFWGLPAQDKTTIAEPLRAMPTTESMERVEALGGDAIPAGIPSLDESDTFVRDLVRRLSSHPRVVGWLRTDGLIRNVVGVVSNIAEGRTSATLLRSLRPSSGFRVVELGDGLYLDPRSYARYTSLSRAVASVDPVAGARLYATLRPLIEEAHRELGFDGSFDRTVERAIVLLLSTPVQPDPVRVEPRGIGYGFVDQELEGLTAAQKQLLRMGPRNARVVQEALRSLGRALGIPSERLPLSTGA